MVAMFKESWMVERFKILMAVLFSGLFLVFAVALGGMAAWQFVAGLAGEELVTGFVRSINTAVIALATFELGMGDAIDSVGRTWPDAS